MTDEETCGTIDAVDVVGDNGIIEGCEVVTGGGCEVGTDGK